MSDHEELNPFDDPTPTQGREQALEKLRAHFPPEQISRLEKRYKDKQGNWHLVELDYVGHADLTARLLDVDPYWNWRPLALDEFGLPRMILSKEGDPVGLWIVLTVCGVSRIGYGSCDEGKSEAAKELIGDALRNAAMRFGAALHLWAKPGKKPQQTPASAAQQRNEPPGQPKPEERPKELDDAAAFFGGEEGGNLSLTVLGVNVPPEFTDWATASQYVLQFGKHKGRALGKMIQDPDDASYLEWMSKQVVAKIKDGQKKVYPSDWFVLVAYDQTLSGHAPIT